MSRSAAYSLYALLSVLVLGGAWLAGPTPGEVGVWEDVDCAEALRPPAAEHSPPREWDSVRLVGCDLDLGADRLYVHGVHVWSEVLPPETRRLRAQLMQLGPAARERYLERHHKKLRVTVDLEGDVAWNDWGDWVNGVSLRPATKPAGIRAFGVAMLMLFVPLLVVFRRADQRWSQALESHRSGASKPAQF